MKTFDSLRRALGAMLVKRTRRERIALTVMAASVVAALWFQLLWTAHHERTRHARLIGDLQVQNNAMRQAKDAMLEARRHGGIVRPLNADKAIAEFASGLKVAGASGFTTLPDSEGRIRLAGNAEFDVWLSWLAKAHADHGIQVVRATIEPTGQAGMVKIEATIAVAGAK